MKPSKSCRDVDQVIEKLKLGLTGVQVTQLQVKHPSADDDGLWFVKVSGKDGEVQIESPHGNCPFSVESDFTQERFHGHTVDEVVSIVSKLFGQLPS